MEPWVVIVCMVGGLGAYNSYINVANCGCSWIQDTLKTKLVKKFQFARKSRCVKKICDIKNGQKF